MLTHEQILNTKLIRLDTGAIVDMNPNLPAHVLVMTRTSVGEEYYNLLRAAAFLYQTVELHTGAIEKMIAVAEECGLDMIVPDLLQLQTGLHLGKRIALEGVEAVSNSLQGKKF